MWLEAICVAVFLLIPVVGGIVSHVELGCTPCKTIPVSLSSVSLGDWWLALMASLGAARASCLQKTALQALELKSSNLQVGRAGHQ